MHPQGICGLGKNSINVVQVSYKPSCTGIANFPSRHQLITVVSSQGELYLSLSLYLFIYLIHETAPSIPKGYAA
jgi:hypothetical protein